MGLKKVSELPRRKSIRLAEWDYSNPSAYFITICTYQKKKVFDDRRFREIAENAWEFIPNHPHAEHAEMREWILMPNHLHGIIILVEREEYAGFDSLETARSGSISSIVGNYKSLVTRRINNVRRTPGERVWQRGYYDRIIRNEREFEAIRAYILANPENWYEDPENLDSIITDRS